MKNNRHQMIIDLIKSKKISTHDQLVAELEEKGVKVTQATVSRDIKELGIVKIPDENGSIYAVVQEWEHPLQKFTDDVTNVANAGNIVVIHTKPGIASAVTAAIDVELGEEIVGSIAGDDTIFLVVNDAETADLLSEKMRRCFSFKRKA